MCFNKVVGNILVWIRLNSLHICLDKAKNHLFLWISLDQSMMRMF